MVKNIHQLGKAIEEIKKKYSNKILDIQEAETECIIRIEPTVLIEIARDLKNAGYNQLSFVTAVDNNDMFTLVYAIFSTYGKDGVLLKADISREKPEIKSVIPIWQAANWHEREVFDLFGINFTDHPDLRRIFLPDDWEGHPLRKDFTHPNMVRRPDNY